MRVERGDVSGELGSRQRQVRRHADEGSDAYHLAVADASHGRDPDDLAGGIDLARGGKFVGLAGGRAEPIADAGERAAQGRLDAFGNGPEGGFAVEGGVDSAAHQRRAA